MRRFLLFYLGPTFALLGWLVWPLVAGVETLYLRDTLNAHLMLKAGQAEQLRAGALPLLDPARGGQPLVGNPNAVPLYPTNLLYLVSPSLWALNAHFWLHLLLAPLAAYWMARAWGLRREAAWATGVLFAGSGFFLSQLNLYNLVAGVALAPALVAASLDLAAGRRPRVSLLAAALVWALLLLAGDPQTALLALLLAVTAVVAAGELGRRRAMALVAALGLGTAVALPQLVELLRAWPASYRGELGFAAPARLMASWDPRTIVEWLVPFPFGSPVGLFWGEALHAGRPPFYYSLYPGLLALPLVAASTVAWRRRAVVWAWGAITLGLFVALGEWNPLVRLATALPGAEALRIPVKAWPLVAVGASLLGGVGFAAWLQGRGGRRLLACGLAVGGLLAVAWGAFVLLPGAVEAGLRGAIPERLPDAFVAAERSRLAVQLGLSLALLAAMGLVAWLNRDRPLRRGGIVLGLHLLGQVVLLVPLADGDRASAYREAPAPLAALPEGSRVVHGGYRHLFGPPRWLGPAPIERRDALLQRRFHEEVHPFTGIRWGRRYELAASPEGLDTATSRLAADAVRSLGDAERLRLLEAFGVERLLLDRPLEAGDPGRARLLERFPVPHGELHVYELAAAAPAVQLVGRVLRAAHPGEAVTRLLEEGFEPWEAAVVTGEGEALDGPRGEVWVVEEGAERLEIAAESEAPGLLVVQRAHHPLWRAWIEGRPAPVVVANLYRLGVELPAGRHTVELRVDRRPFRWSLAAAAAALLALGALVWRSGR